MERMSALLSFFVRETKTREPKMNPNNPADPSAQTPRFASRQGSVKVALLCIIIIAVLAASLFLSMRRARELNAEVALAREEVIALKAVTQSEANSENIAKALTALQELKESGSRIGANIDRLGGRVDTLVSKLPSDSKNVQVLPSDESKGGAQNKGTSKLEVPSSNVDGAAAKPARMVFIRVDDKDIAPKGDRSSSDYAIPAGKEHASRRFSLDQIKEGRVAVSRNPGLRALVTWPPAKKIGLIPDWRIYGLLGSGNTVKDEAVPIVGGYVEFKQWAGAKSVRFYWTDDAGNKDPLLIKFYKE
jgi:hypothetical protein